MSIDPVQLLDVPEYLGRISENLGIVQYRLYLVDVNLSTISRLKKGDIVIAGTDRCYKRAGVADILSVLRTEDEGVWAIETTCNWSAAIPAIAIGDSLYLHSVQDTSTDFEARPLYGSTDTSGIEKWLPDDHKSNPLTLDTLRVLEGMRPGAQSCPSGLLKATRGDLLGALRQENRDLLAENALLRRQLERLQPKGKK